LHRRDTDIQHDPIDAFVAVGLGDFVEGGKGALDQRQAIAGVCPQRRRGGDGRRVAVDGDDVRASGENGGGVAACPEGAVDEGATGDRREETNGLLHEDRDMASQSASDTAARCAATRHHSPDLEVTPVAW
jgi:hypothetical protein